MLRMVVIPPTQRNSPHRLRFFRHHLQQSLPVSIPPGNKPSPPALAILILTSCRIFHLIADPARRRQLAPALTQHTHSIFCILCKYHFPIHKLPSHINCTSRTALDLAYPSRLCMVSAEPADGFCPVNKLHLSTQIHLLVSYLNMYLVSVCICILVLV